MANQMNLVESGTGRSVIEQVGNEMHISIPSKKQLGVLLLTPIGYAIFALVFVRGRFGEFLTNSPLGWIFLGVFSFFAVRGVLEWLWTIAGKEIISATPQHFCIEKKLLGLKISRRYDSKLIDNFHVIPGSPTSSFVTGGRYTPSYKGGTIGFAYGNKTKKFGIFLEEAEARYIIDELRKHGYIRGETAKQ